MPPLQYTLSEAVIFASIHESLDDMTSYNLFQLVKLRQNVAEKTSPDHC